MSLIRRLPEADAGSALPPTAALPPRRLLERVRQSMAAQIALAISVVTLVLVLMGTWMVGRLLSQEFDDMHPTELTLQEPAHLEQLQKERRDAFAKRAWRIVLITLCAGAMAASLFAWWIARRVLASAERLGNTANRISAAALSERLIPGHSPTELEPVTLAFNRMLDRLQDAFDRLSGFSSDLAHDLRAPIHRLLTATQVTLARPRTAEEYRAVLESAVADYERIGRFIENILFLARADHAQTTIHPIAMPLAQRLQNTADFFELLAEEKGLRLALEVQGEARVWADDILLSRAVGNLLTNALRHARRGSTVVLSAIAAPNGSCRISVANEGLPIAPEHQSRIFERRYQIDDPESPVTRSATGMGLGLAIVKSTMDLHGGTASVHSAPGQATVFTLSFPPPPDADPGAVRSERHRSPR
jgi:two-component system heavy metal sensor histidine kinase CusS